MAPGVTVDQTFDQMVDGHRVNVLSVFAHCLPFLRHDVPQVKLYFMIGLPGETDEDVLGIADTIRWLQRSCRQGPLHLAVHVTISNFTPKPHTPFQVGVA